MPATLTRYRFLQGNYILRYWAQTKSEPIASKGEITFSLPVRTLEEKQEPQADESRLAQGLWSRKTTLQPGEIWDVSSVLGILPPASNAAPSWPIWNGNA